MADSFIVTARVLFDIMTLVDICPMEVSFWGRVKRNGGILTVWELLLPNQTVGPAHVNGGEGLNDLCKNLADVSDLNFMGHSHVNMAAFFSQTDREQMKDLRELGMKYAISAVFNKQKKYIAEEEIFEYNIVVPRLKLEVDYKDSWENLASRKEELQKLVAERVHCVETPHIYELQQEGGFIEFPSKKKTKGWVTKRATPPTPVYWESWGFIPRMDFKIGDVWEFISLDAKTTMLLEAGKIARVNGIYQVSTESIPNLETILGIRVYGAQGKKLEYFSPSQEKYPVENSKEDTRENFKGEWYE